MEVQKSGEGMADWVSIKTEYITTQISTRDLANKYGVKYATLRDRSAKEKWSELRAAHVSRTVAKTEQKTAEAISDIRANRIVQLMEGGKLAAGLLVERLHEMHATGKIKTYEVKAITEALKNVRDLYKTDELPADDDPLIKYMEEMRNA